MKCGDHSIDIIASCCDVNNVFLTITDVWELWTRTGFRASEVTCDVSLSSQFGLDFWEVWRSHSVTVEKIMNGGKILFFRVISTPVESLRKLTYFGGLVNRITTLFFDLIDVRIWVVCHTIDDLSRWGILKALIMGLWGVEFVGPFCDLIITLFVVNKSIIKVVKKVKRIVNPIFRNWEVLWKFLIHLFLSFWMVSFRSSMIDFISLSRRSTIKFTARRVTISMYKNLMR